MMKSLKCSCCNRKIKGQETVYLYENKVYCVDCTKIISPGVYKFKNKSYLTKGIDVSEILILEDRIKSLKESIQYFKKLLNGKHGSERKWLQKAIIGRKKTIKILTGDDE